VFTGQPKIPDLEGDRATRGSSFPGSLRSQNTVHPTQQCRTCSSPEHHMRTTLITNGPVFDSIIKHSQSMSPCTIPHRMQTRNLRIAYEQRSTYDANTLRLQQHILSEELALSLVGSISQHHFRLVRAAARGLDISCTRWSSIVNTSQSTSTFILNPRCTCAHIHS
jgi:hypothetical protein